MQEKEGPASGCWLCEDGVRSRTYEVGRSYGKSGGSRGLEKLCFVTTSPALELESPEGQQWGLGLGSQLRDRLWMFLNVSMKNKAVGSHQQW